MYITIQRTIPDILFLIQNQLITIEQLAAFVETAVSQTDRFDLNATAMRRHLEIVHQSL